MPDVTIVYWRDIPAQVTLGKGRSAERHPLPERFEKAIDRAAMRAKLRDTDSYLAEWRRADPVDCGADLEAEAASQVFCGADAPLGPDRFRGEP